MSLVAAAADAMVFRTWPDHLEVALGLQGPGDMGEETGPAGAAVVLGLRAEERQVTTRAEKYAVALLVIEGAGKRSFSSFFPQYFIGCRR